LVISPDTDVGGGLNDGSIDGKNGVLEDSAARVLLDLAEHQT
jgi:hypothetical protein